MHKGAVTMEYINNLAATKVPLILDVGTNSLHDMKVTGMLTGNNFEKMFPPNTEIKVQLKFKIKWLKRAYTSFQTPTCTD